MLLRSTYIKGLILAFVMPVMGVAQDELPLDDGALVSAALLAADEGDWGTAQSIADRIGVDGGKILVTWTRLRAGEGEWWEYRQLLADHADWPGLKRLRRAGEAKIPKGANSEDVRAYFAPEPPQTGLGAMRLAEAYMAIGRTAEARDEMIRAWTTLTLTRDEQEKILDGFRGMIEQHHVTRLENLLWKGATSEASQMLGLVSPNRQKLAQARIGLQRAVPNVDQLIEAVPSEYASDAGLAYDRFQWRIKKGRWDDAEALLYEQTVSKQMGRAEAWSSRRRGFARRAMRAGQIDKAYALASNHHLISGSDFADLEWLAGYLALRYKSDADLAVEHFTRFAGAVGSPISVGRAHYWLGRAEQARKNYAQAEKQYGLGAAYPTSFYGQLAAEQLRLSAFDGLSGANEMRDWQSSSFANSTVLQAVALLAEGEEHLMVRWFLTHMAETLQDTELLQLATFADEIGQDFSVLGIAKEGAKRGIILPSIYFPVTDLAGYSVDVPPEVAMSIARRESELSPDAISPVGARGLMQLMPKTAKQVAQELGMSYSKARLTNDWRYNATLGTAYLASLVEIYEGSYLLAFAAYNAGPSRVNSWLETYGDPRDKLTDPIDWIEHIPYRETRNYVMRVMESLHVYRAQINGKAEPVRLSKDLSRG